jgi:hypothetical protein
VAETEQERREREDREARWGRAIAREQASRESTRLTPADAPVAPQAPPTYNVEDLPKAHEPGEGLGHRQDLGEGGAHNLPGVSRAEGVVSPPNAREIEDQSAQRMKAAVKHAAGPLNYVVPNEHNMAAAKRGLQAGGDVIESMDGTIPGAGIIAKGYHAASGLIPGQEPTPDQQASPPPEAPPADDHGPGLTYEQQDQQNGQPPPQPPAGPQVTTIPEHEQHDYSLARQADIYNRGQDVANAPAKIAEAEAARFDEQGEAQIAAAKQQQAMIAGQAAAEADRLQELRDRQDDLAERAQAATEGKVDPEHFWGSRTVPQKIFAVLGLALSGIGAAMSGTPNGAMAIITKQIDDDIHAQETNLKSRQNGLHLQKGLLADQLKSFGDMTAAKTATRVAYLQASLLQIEGLANKATSPIQKARAQELAAQIQKSLAEEITKMNPMVQAKTVVTGGAGAKPPDVWEQAKKVADEKIPEQDMALQQLDAVLKSNGGQPQGIGTKWDILFGDDPASTRGKLAAAAYPLAAQNRQIVRRAQLSTIKEDAARMNPAALQIVQGASGNTPEQLRSWHDDRRQSVEALKGDLRQGAGPARVAQLNANSDAGHSALDQTAPARAFPGKPVSAAAAEPGPTRARAAPTPTQKPIDTNAPAPAAKAGKGGGGGKGGSSKPADFTRGIKPAKNTL